MKQEKVVYIFLTLLVFSEARYTYNQVFKQSNVSIIKSTLSKGWYNIRDTLHHYKSQLSELELVVLAMMLGNSYLLTSSIVQDDVDTEQNVTTNDVRNGQNLECSLKEVDKLSQLNCTQREENQSNCARDIQRLFLNISDNIWTLQFFDSWGKPGPSILQESLHFVGNYKQCRKAKAPSVIDEPDSIFNGKYCLLTISSKNVKKKINANLEPVLLRMGSCLPDSCSEYEITKMLQQ
ncbi:nose resistant to fluoxetine protein 6, partial [Biomphalaria glabrata]